MASDLPSRQCISVASIAEFSEPISETDEIESVRKLQKLGDKAFKKKDYAAAAACYKEALEIDEENVQLLSKRAVSNIELKDYQEARIDADILVKLNPHVPQGHYLLAVCLDNLEEYGAAITAFLRALRYDQNHQTQLVDNVAVVAANLCHFPDDVLQKLDDCSPIEKLMIVAECMYESKQYDVCIHVQQTIQDLKQTDKETKLKSQYLLAMCYQKLEELDRALDQFHTLLSQSLSHKNDIYEASAYHNLAQLNLKVGQIHHGIVFYEKLLSICEDLRQRNDGADATTSKGEMDYLVGDRLQKHVHEILTSAYRAASDLSQALFHADQYLSKTVQEDVSKDKEVVGKAYLLVGFLREGLGDYATALKHYQEYLAVSKTKNDKSGIARAYGCLGRVYHRLCNFSLAQSFYEQQHAIAEKFKYLQMVASALKNLAKLFTERENNDEAFKCLEKYLRVSRKLDEFYTECEAFIDIGDFYQHQDRVMQSEYYYEQAFNLAERTKLTGHLHKAASKLAQVLVQSDDEKKIEKARFLCEESMKYCQRVQMVHEEDGTVVPEEIQQCLLRSSSMLKISLCQLQRNLEALEIAEEQNSSSFQEILAKQTRDDTIDQRSSMTFQDICKLVNSQSSTVVYYDVTDLGVLTWVLKPNKGCVHFVREVPEGRQRSSEYLKDLVSSIHSSEGGLESMYDCEYRALPMLDSETYKMQLYFKSMSRNYTPISFTSRAYSAPGTPSGKTTQVPLRTLHHFLWEPIAEHVTEGEVIIVPNDVLTQLSFDSLTDNEGHRLGETLNMTSIPSLMVLKHLINNQANINNLYLADSQATDDQASQVTGDEGSKLNPASPIYLDHMNRVVVPQSTLPHQPIMDTVKVAPEMAATRMYNPSHVAFDRTFHGTMRDGRDPVLAQEERRVREGCARGSTLISKTWSGGEVPSVRDGRVGTYRQREGIAGIVAMGNPTLPEKMRLHGKIWKPNSDLEIAQMETHKIADYLHTEPYLGSKVTKEAILSALPTATLIHLALYGSWEDGVLACTPNPTTQPMGDGVYPEGAYQIGVQDILGMKLCSQLVVLSCGYGNRHRTVHLDLPLAFIAAGAQCVLVMLWAVNDLVRNKFWHHFYLSLQEGTMVSQAVQAAKQAIRQDNRFQDARNWGAFHVIGFDQYINLMTIKHAMVDHQLNQTQKHVLNNMKEDALNLREDNPEDKTDSALITKLCSHMASALTHHVHFPTVLSCILSLLQQTKKLLSCPEGEPFPSWILPVEVFTSPAAVPLLNLMGFHFQPRGPTSYEPFVVFPTRDLDGLLDPALQAFEALIAISKNTEVSHCLAKVLTEHEKLSSGLIDILSITKHMPEIQLRCNDSGIHSMWVDNTAREILQAMGFRQVGKLILFEGSKSNKNQLYAVLQVLCAVCGEKGKNMLERLDMRYLGLAPSRLAAKSPRQSPSKSARLKSSSTVRLTTPPKTISRLRTLNPVVLPGNKMDFSTPWWSEEARQTEVTEKMKLAKDLSAVHVGYSQRMQKNRRWHLEAIAPQAREERDKVGLAPSKPRKVKMKPGASPSIPRVPIDYVEPLTAEAIEQRRDYAHFLSRVRSLDLEKRHQGSVQGLFLPYVNNTKAEAK
ncbi:tetratricopeptide repeat protein 28-like [Lytechinus variegatus]|uniref:tetratricopeptide repeat protein 28-like n=1 Tax=Lytechinus variegatus TaxID=7654 RepID=UPI001BB0DD0A|nr:tetratricopeptide repeat protein 28-like [Lytechinus variegatus]